MGAPSAFQAVDRKARKEHKCCECGIKIMPGTVYRYSSGVWDGQGRSFKQCLNCGDIMEAAASTSRWDGPEPPVFCDLREWFMGNTCQGYQGRELLDDQARLIGISPEDLNRLLKIKLEESIDE